MCKISVVTTCFNPGESLEKTIKSVLSQTYDDFEYIIQDGGSSDNAIAIAKSYEKDFADKGIPFFVYSEKDSGIYDGMNKAVVKANGDFVNFMNADDIFFDEHVLENIFGDNRYDDSDIIYGDCVELEYGEYYYFPKDVSKIRSKMPFSHQSVFAKRALLETFPFRTELRIGGDYDFLLSADDNEVKFSDCGCCVCITTKDGVSSTDLYNTFVETIEIQKYHGIVRFSDKELDKKLFYLRIRQMGMDYLPVFVKKIIRKIQRRMRGQNDRVKI